MADVKLNRLDVPDTATDLNGYSDRPHQIQDNFSISGRSGKRSVKIYDMDTFSPLSLPLHRDLSGIFCIDCHPAEIALGQPDTFAVLQINSRYDDQRSLQ
jgi:hypothetical protein